MYCKDCEYNGQCSVQTIASDITGCTGHSKMKPEVEAALMAKFQTDVNCDPIPTREYTKLEDLKIGDRVKACSTTGTSIPTYLECSPMTVIGFTKAGNVKCDYDGGKPFHIPPNMLIKIEN